MTSLTGKQLRYLRSLGQRLKASIQIGKNGFSENTARSIENGFNTKELLKIKVQDGCMEDLEELASQVAERTDAALVQIIGKNFLLYKPHHEHPVLKLPN